MCKKPLLEQNFSLIKVSFGQFFSWLKFCPNHWAIFSRKKFAQCHKKSPKWQNFDQSGHPASYAIAIFCTSFAASTFARNVTTHL
jgi:hypothetical protein